MRRRFFAAMLALVMCLGLCGTAGAKGQPGEDVVTPDGMFLVENVISQDEVNGTPIYWVYDHDGRDNSFVNYGATVYIVAKDLKEGESYTVEHWERSWEDQYSLELISETGEIWPLEELHDLDNGMRGQFVDMVMPIDSCAFPEAYTAEKASRITFRGSSILIGYLDSGTRYIMTGSACGVDEDRESVLCILDNKGLLRVTGKGPMKDNNECPWMNQLSMVPVMTIQVDEGVTCTGVCTFYMTEVRTVILPKSVTRIGRYSFDGCKYLTDIYYAGSEADWKAIVIEDDNDSIPNATIHFNSTGPAPEAPAAPAEPVTATPTSATILVDGRNLPFEAYNIGGANYFKLRDLAFAVSGTPKQFSVGWDGAAKVISLFSGSPYEAVGGEMSHGNTQPRTAAPTTSRILKDGLEISLTAYNIGGANYFKLRDIGALFDFGVGWDSATQTITIDTTTGYTAG